MGMQQNKSVLTGSMFPLLLLNNGNPPDDVTQTTFAPIFVH